MRTILLITLASLCLPFTSWAQSESQQLSLGAGYADQVWYSLGEGEKGRTALDSWDLAFSIQGFAASILVNDAKGLELYLYPNGDTAAWASVDTAGMSNWAPYYNSATDWSAGAFNRGNDPTDDFDLGWGTYSFITHHVTGDSLFVLKFPNGSVQKLWLVNLASGTYTFRHATLDGSMDMTHTVAKPDFSGKSFAYYSLSDHSSLDPEPPAADWDLLFTQYIDFIPVPYGVTGVLSKAGVEVAEVNGVSDVAGYNDHGSAAFDTVKNVIGYDWKTFNMTTFTWELAEDRVYFVKDLDGEVWKLVFTDFGGSANGNFEFSQERMTPTSLAPGQAAPFLSIYPNPVRGSQLNLIADLEAAIPASLSWYDLQGREVHQQALSPQSGLESYRLPVPALPAGTYLLRVQQGNQQAMTRVQLTF